MLEKLLVCHHSSVQLCSSKSASVLISWVSKASLIMLFCLYGKFDSVTQRDGHSCVWSGQKHRRDTTKEAHGLHTQTKKNKQDVNTLSLVGNLPKSINTTLFYFILSLQGHIMLCPVEVVTGKIEDKQILWLSNTKARCTLMRINITI